MMEVIMKAENDFSTNTSKATGKSFREVVGKPLFGVSLLLTGLAGVGGLISCIPATLRGAWERLGPTEYLRSVLPVLVYLTAFVILLVMNVSERPFSRTLVRGVTVIGLLYVLFAVLLPRLPDYVYNGAGIGILVLQGRPLLDGAYLLPGLLFFLLGAILRAGFTMQRELDEIL